jgi:hypothetical protein
MNWTDGGISWNPSWYGNKQSIPISNRNIWTPSLMLANAKLNGSEVSVYSMTSEAYVFHTVNCNLHVCESNTIPIGVYNHTVLKRMYGTIFLYMRLHLQLSVIRYIIVLL